MHHAIHFFLILFTLKWAPCGCLVVVLLHYTLYIFCVSWSWPLHWITFQSEWIAFRIALPNRASFNQVLFLSPFSFSIVLQTSYLPTTNTYRRYAICSVIPNIYISGLSKPIMFSFHFLCNYSFVMTLNIEIEKNAFVCWFSLFQVDWSAREKDSHFCWHSFNLVGVVKLGVGFDGKC